MTYINKKYRFLLSNLTKGLFWLLIIAALFWVFKTHFEDWYSVIMDSIANKPLLVIATFTFSELFFGIFPPELFMIWALHQGAVQEYVYYAALLAIISLCAGIIGYFIGRWFSQTKLYMRFKSKFGTQLENNVKKYGGFMIFIAAITPIPFSGTCMITGASRYNFLYFLLISTSRLLRFAVYAYAIWEVNKI